MFHWLFTEGKTLLGGCLTPLLCLTAFTPLVVAGLLGAGIQRTGETASFRGRRRLYLLFAYAVVNLRLGDGHGLELVRQLRRGQATMRIVIATDADSFASVVAALRAGADDYVAQPATHAELLDALRGRSPLLPPVPDTPLGLSRICWEHVMRIYEQCDRNVTLTARRLRMHRRSLQRLLSKRSPLLRGAVDP